MTTQCGVLEQSWPGSFSPLDTDAGAIKSSLRIDPLTNFVWVPPMEGVLYSAATDAGRTWLADVHGDPGTAGGVSLLAGGAAALSNSLTNTGSRAIRVRWHLRWTLSASQLMGPSAAEHANTYVWLDGLATVGSVPADPGAGSVPAWAEALGGHVSLGSLVTGGTRMSEATVLVNPGQTLYTKLAIHYGREPGAYVASSLNACTALSISNELTGWPVSWN